MVVDERCLSSNSILGSAWIIYLEGVFQVKFRRRFCGNQKEQIVI